MKILHTSDWHIGKTLYGEKRYSEFKSFFEWLLEVIIKEKIDVLLVCGDIFDTGTPGNKAQEIYFDFLAKVSATQIRKVIITGGNHDSPSFLEASKKILSPLKVDVVGSISDNPENEIVCIYQDNDLCCIVGAVPYLRDKDIRNVSSDESIDDKNIKLIHGIRNHYNSVWDRMKFISESHDGQILSILTGHLFTSGGKTSEGDGVRELYVGTVTHVSSDIFPEEADYVALGHLHQPQIVNGKENIRYSGSPLCMSFSEKDSKKEIVILEYDNGEKNIRTLEVPCFQKLMSISGNMSHIMNELSVLKEKHCDCWLEINYEGDEISGDINNIVNEIVKDSDLKVLRIRNRKIMNYIFDSEEENVRLEDMSPEKVFESCLEQNNVSENQRDVLKILFSEVMKRLYENS